MSTLREAAQQALEALELAQTDVHWELNSPTRKFLRKAEKTLRAALAQQDEPVWMHPWPPVRAQQDEPVQKPVAWLYEEGADSTLHWNKPPLYGTPLYTAPPKRQPETIDEALQQPRAMAQAYEAGYKAGEAHERERCLRLIDDHVRAVDAEDVVRAIKEVRK